MHCCCSAEDENSREMMLKSMHALLLKKMRACLKAGNQALDA